jgi:hypothetical protein
LAAPDFLPLVFLSAVDSSVFVTFVSY